MNNSKWPVRPDCPKCGEPMREFLVPVYDHSEYDPEYPEFMTPVYGASVTFQCAVCEPRKD